MYRMNAYAMIALALLSAPLGAQAASTQAPADTLARRKRAECVAAFNDTKSPNRQNQVEKKILSIHTDQDALQKFSLEFARLDGVMKAARAKNDTAELRRTNEAIIALLAVDAKDDSIATVRKCGPVLPPPVGAPGR